MPVCLEAYMLVPTCCHDIEKCQCHHKNGHQRRAHQKRGREISLLKAPSPHDPRPRDPEEAPAEIAFNTVGDSRSRSRKSS
mmetsp:Transcript_17983/g.49949  ORF Transcript_17983/g.49949 Transcript_17983/m.49949 type:complete len:81 (-) Transcript_17983:1613-1855(-)